MMRSTCDTPTDHASRYLQQLCKHWMHKFAVEFDAQAGRIALADDVALAMRADPAALHLELDAPDADTLERWQVVVANHLERFGFREELVFDWKAA